MCDACCPMVLPKNLIWGAFDGFVVTPCFFRDTAPDDDVLAFVEHRFAGVVVPDLFQVASDFV